MTLDVFYQSHSQDSLSFAIRMYAGTVVNPIRVEARKRRSPEINWYLLKSNFLTVMGCITPNSLMECKFF
jgi:hypothetical protein